MKSRAKKQSHLWLNGCSSMIIFVVSTIFLRVQNILILLALLPFQVCCAEDLFGQALHFLGHVNFVGDIFPVSFRRAASKDGHYLIDPMYLGLKLIFGDNTLSDRYRLLSITIVLLV